jgi:hypothetical protein
MSVSDAEHQTRLENQYFVDTGKPPFDSLYQFYKDKIKIKSEQERRIQALETQIAELQDKLKPTTELAEIRQHQINEFKERVSQLQTQFAKKELQLRQQLTKRSQDIDKLKFNILQNLCKETTFACQLLKSAVKTVPQDILQKDEHLFLHVQAIERYIKEYAPLADTLLVLLVRQTDQNSNHWLANLNDGHDLNLSELSDNQHKVVKILLTLMKNLTKQKHFESDAQLYANVMTNYYNTHSSNPMQMMQAELDVEELLKKEIKQQKEKLQKEKRGN